MVCIEFKRSKARHYNEALITILNWKIWKNLSFLCKIEGINKNIINKELLCYDCPLRLDVDSLLVFSVVDSSTTYQSSGP